MKKVILYIAQSIDGYIARNDGSVDFLENIDNDDQSDHGYSEFMAGIDTVVMGRKTFEVIESFDIDWPYPTCKSYVVSRKEDYKTGNKDVEILQSNIAEEIEKLKTEPGKDIWLLGGGELVKYFFQNDLIDEIMLSIVPVVLGSGIPLFPASYPECKFEMYSVRDFSSGIVTLSYKKVQKQ
jgi:dihydrofolate reductase